MLHIDIWTDFGCPACYLAKPRIDQAIAASGHAGAITVTYRSLELFPDAGAEPFDSFEHVLRKFGGDQAQAARLEEHMAALARAQGQPYAIHHPVASSFDAHRMLHLAAEHGAASEFMDAVQRDLLGEGVNVYTTAYLANAATRAGVPAARAKALLAGDEYANAVRADEKLARGGRRHRRPLHHPRRTPGDPGRRDSQCLRGRDHPSPHHRRPAVNPPKLTILTADTDAACDPETGTCAIPQTPIPSPGAAPATGPVLPGLEETAGA